MGARFTRVAGLIVTVEPLTVAMPVKSSMMSSWPDARLEFARGSVKSLVTVVPEELARFKASVVPVIVMAFERLRSIPSPALPLMVCEVVIVDVKGPVNEAVQTAPATHTGFVSATPVPLKKMSSAVKNETAMEL